MDVQGRWCHWGGPGSHTIRGVLPLYGNYLVFIFYYKRGVFGIGKNLYFLFYLSINPLSIYCLLLSTDLLPPADNIHIIARIPLLTLLCWFGCWLIYGFTTELSWGRGETYCLSI